MVNRSTNTDIRISKIPCFLIYTKYANGLPFVLVLLAGGLISLCFAFQIQNGTVVFNDLFALCIARNDRWVNLLTTMTKTLLLNESGSLWHKTPCKL